MDLLCKNDLPIDDSEILSKENQYNEIILNGLRLNNGINLSDLKEFNMINQSQIDKVIDKWDCLSLLDENLKLTKNGFLFVDEITKDLFV